MKANTRDRLVSAARELLHKNGLHRTSLAEIAAGAGVPLGNVYYHFKTKESLVAAVIDEYAADLCRSFMRWEDDENPRARLKHFVGAARNVTEVFARYGCPQGSLCSELDRDADSLSKAASNLLKLQVDWAAEQFKDMGHVDAQDLALDLVTSLQGSYLLTSAYRSGALLQQRLGRIEKWIDGLPATPPIKRAGQASSLMRVAMASAR